MSKYRKSEMLKTIRLLEEANDTVGKDIAKSERDDIVDVLRQCQEAAIVLGEYLETLDDAARELVGILEDYCENLYQMSIAREEFQCKKISKKIRKQLVELHNQIKYNLPEDKKEIVFLPYKASMWDSLESVWKEADADVECDAYVIPIPYYDKNPDGSFLEMHYEANQFPDYVPITYYGDYDFETRRPDKIYIHNPYDEWNYVTSVHPFFYSKNLKKYTDELVYIPYFILEEPRDENGDEGMTHFCALPGVYNADKVIVQSENMKKVYVNILCKENGEETRDYWNQKIFGLGSPKVDKLLNTHKADVNMPEEWTYIIKKHAFETKKVILYNTSVSALLHNDMDMIEKIKEVLSIFKERKDEVALLWRPHPLIQATIKSMRPQLWEQYRKIVEEYCQEGWGIYDDSADLDRAIVISDAYYGDHSSVVHLCQKVNKSVQIQNAACRRAHKYIADIGDYIIVDNAFVAASPNLNGIIKGDILLNTVQFIPNIDSKQGTYMSCGLIEGKIYCAPMDGNKILVYGLNDEKLSYIDLPQNQWANQYNKLYNIVTYNDKCFFLPGKYPYIVMCDMNGHVELYAVDIEKVRTQEYMFIESIIVMNEIVILGSWDNNILCTFNMESCEFTYYQLPLEIKGCRSLCMYQNNFYLSDVDGRIYNIDVFMKKINCIYEQSGEIYRKSVYWNNRVILFPEKGKEIIVINPQNNIIEKKYCDELNQNGLGFGFINTYDDTLTIYQIETQELLFFNKDMKIERKMKYVIEKIIKKGNMNKNVFLTENIRSPEVSLENFIISLQGQ